MFTHRTVHLMGGGPLPNCTALPKGAWHEVDPRPLNDIGSGEQPERPLLGDSSGEWDKGQLIAPPANPEEQPAWLAALQEWRESCRGPLGLDQAPVVFDDPQLRWTQTSFVHVQMHPFDRLFFDTGSGKYTVRRWLDDLRERFGGVDAALLWPTYPMLGIDDRNAYDMIRSLPGGLEAVRGVVRELHAEGVRVQWPFTPWDTETRYEGAEPDAMLLLTCNPTCSRPATLRAPGCSPTCSRLQPYVLQAANPCIPGAEPEAMLRLLNQTGADGVNGDTLYSLPEAFYRVGVDAGGPHAALQAQMGGLQPCVPGGCSPVQPWLPPL